MKLIRVYLPLFFVIAIYMTNCKNSENTTNTQTVVAPTATVADSPKPTMGTKAYDVQVLKTSPPDTLFVDVYSNGKIKIGSRDIPFDSLTNNLADSLRKIKKKTGKFPKVIHSRSNGEVLMGVRGATHDAINDAKDSVGFSKERRK